MSVAQFVQSQSKVRGKNRASEVDGLLVTSPVVLPLFYASGLRMTFYYYTAGESPTSHTSTHT